MTGIQLWHKRLERLMVAGLCLYVLSSAAYGAGTTFGDCDDPAYLAHFDPRLASDHDFLCTQSGETVSVPTAAQVAQIRIIEHVAGDWAGGPDIIAAVHRGVQAAVRAMSRIGSFNLKNTTILLWDEFPPSDGDEKFSNFAAWTKPTGHECYITLWMLGPGGTPDNAAHVVAHELFHCIEGATLSSEQMATSGDPNAQWWSEGAASWFATLAVPAPPYIEREIKLFDKDSPTTPLYRMSYPAQVFFDWLGGTQGTGAVMPFLREMAASPGEPAQQSAMGRALAADQWLKFAEDYLDRRIVDGQGKPLNSTPSQGNTWEWTRTQTRNIPLKPFVLRRGHIDFACGKWSVKERSPHNHATRLPAKDTWSELPKAIDTSSGAHRDHFRFAGFSARAELVHATISVKRTATCQKCGGVKTIDRCLVGQWRESNAGPSGLKELKGIISKIVKGIPGGSQALTSPLTHYGLKLEGKTSGGAQSVSRLFRADGTYLDISKTATIHGRGRFSKDDKTIFVSHTDSNAFSFKTMGRWSAGEGKINFCPEKFDVAGGGVISRVNGTAVSQVSAAHIRQEIHSKLPTPPAAATYSRGYSCGGGQATIGGKELKKMGSSAGR